MKTILKMLESIPFSNAFETSVKTAWIMLCEIPLKFYLKSHWNVCGNDLKLCEKCMWKCIKMYESGMWKCIKMYESGMWKYMNQGRENVWIRGQKEWESV